MPSTTGLQLFMKYLMSVIGGRIDLDKGRIYHVAELRAAAKAKAVPQGTSSILELCSISALS